MKNKKVNSLKLAVSVIMFAVMAIVVSSCKSNEDTFSAEDTATASNESTSESQTAETDDIASGVLNANDNVSGRVEAGADDLRLTCATITKAAGNTREAGTITVDFGTTGCTDAAKNTRKGKLIISWTGNRWFLPGSTHTIKYSGYSVNDVKFSDNDSRVVTNVSSPALPLTWTIAANHNLTYPDATTSSRTENKTKQWKRSATIVDDTYIVSQTFGAVNAATGTNRKGKSYTMKITTPLVYSRACAITNKVFKPVSGVKVVTIDNKDITFDFGTGTCDNTYTVTVNGKTKTITAKNDGSPD